MYDTYLLTIVKHFVGRRTAEQIYMLTDTAGSADT